jgi:cell division septal protein FtsQ
MRDRPAARRSMPAGAHGRRTRPIRRASAGLSRVRAGAALVALASAAAIYGVAASSAFDYAKLRIVGAHYTDVTVVEGALASIRGDNLFQIDTRPLEAQLGELTTVARARVEVELPDTLAVTLEEREPILVWKIGARRYLVDAAGDLFARLPEKPPADAAALPVVDDHRAASAGLSVGRALEAVDLDAATRLASLRPADVGSASESLAVSLTDENGFIVRSRPSGWAAVFGFYTPSLRTTGLIPGQVRLLRSLIVGREAQVDRVILASDTDGTYIPRPTPSAKPSAKPSAAP